MEGDLSNSSSAEKVELIEAAASKSSQVSSSTLQTNSVCSCSNNSGEKSKADPDTDEVCEVNDAETANAYQCTCDTAKNSDSDSPSSQEETEAEPNLIQNSQRRNRPHIILSKDGKKPKLRTSKDIYDRLKWDSASVSIKDLKGEDQAIDVSSVYVGYKDRFLGMCELPLEDFEPGGEIPFHRVYYFRTGGPPVEPFVGEEGELKVRDHNLPQGAVFIWDRDSRTDLVFKSGNSIRLKHK